MKYCYTCGSLLQKGLKKIRSYDTENGKPIFHIRKTCPKIKESWWLRQINNSGPSPQLHVNRYFIIK